MNKSSVYLYSIVVITITIIVYGNARRPLSRQGKFSNIDLTFQVTPPKMDSIMRYLCGCSLQQLKNSFEIFAKASNYCCSWVRQLYKTT